MNRLISFYDAIEAWMLWAIVTGFGLALAAAILPALTALNKLLFPAPLDLLASAFVAGALVSLIQWGFLRLAVTHLTRWVLVSGLGAVVAPALIVWTLHWWILPLGFVLAAALAGIVLRGLQSLALKSQGRRKTWSLSTAAGWGTAAALAAPFIAVTGGGAARDGANVAYPLVVGWVLLAMMLIVAFVVCFPKPHERDIDQPAKWLP